MGYITIDSLLDKSQGSVYKLVILASMRAIELSNLQKVDQNVCKDKKVTIQAIEDIRNGIIRIGVKNA
jgi:DNA-directed RNA polymerase omega subunit